MQAVLSMGTAQQRKTNSAVFLQQNNLVRSSTLVQSSKLDRVSIDKFYCHFSLGRIPVDL